MPSHCCQGGGTRRWFISVLVPAVGMGAVVAPSGADNHGYILRDGRRVEMIRSTSELAVTFRDLADVPACAERLTAAGLGAVEDVGAARWSRIKILRTPDTSLKQRKQVKQDPAVVSVRPVFRFEGVDAPIMCSGTIVLRLRPDITNAERDAMFSDYKVRVVATMDGLDGVYLVEPTWDEADEVVRAEALATDWRTLWAQPNLIRETYRRQVGSGDEFFPLQWHLDNTGQDGGTVDADIDAPEAWVISEGGDIRFGIFDDAIDINHEDLRDNYTGIGHDASLQTNDPGANDPTPKNLGDRHGTAVLGLALARANAIGVRGVSFLSQFAATRGLSELLTDFQVAGVFTFARQDNVDVHINSWGRPGPNGVVIEDAIRNAFTDGRGGRGIVIVFASGNDGVENQEGFELSTLPWVIGVGASDNQDRRASFSNFGPNINVLAPGDGGFPALIATTDVSDEQGYVDDGFNVGGLNVFDDGTIVPDLDVAGNYTRFFAGTSAACPIAAGVCGLILATNQQLSATDVRLILEHTADKVDATAAQYNGITSRSDTHGYGRINALAAVEAAQASLTNGGVTWPEPPLNLRIEGAQLAWDQNGGTTEFLVVESDTAFTFVPVDGACYDCGQLGCTVPGAQDCALTPLPPGVTELFTGCVGESGAACATGNTHKVTVDIAPGAEKFFAVYARNAIGRYSFGAGFSTIGSDTGPPIDPGDGSPPPDTPGDEAPAITVSVVPLSGLSPLTVSFSGNAVSVNDIDDTQTLWEFDVGNPSEGTSNSRNTSHTYVAPVDATQEFVARLTMVDVFGNIGSASATITVDGGGNTGGATGNNDVSILVGVPGSPGSDVATGTSPFSVELRLDVSNINGTLQSVFWDLGDGTTAGAGIVPHTYVNDSDQTRVFPVTVQVSTLTSAGTPLQATASRSITVFPTPPAPPEGSTHQEGTGVPGGDMAVDLCAAGMLPPMLLATASLVWVRRRRRV